MKTTDPYLERWRETLTDLASRMTGFRPDAIRVGAMEKILREAVAYGISLENLPESPSKVSSNLAGRLTEVVPVGETYFFRQPEHFRYLERKVLPFRDPGPFKVWSAGCATGEEAYSLAACLQNSSVLLSTELQVLGTDLSQKHLEKAQKGVYHSCSLRQKGELYPLFEELNSKAFQVRPELKQMTRFFQHNLLKPLPAEEGPFDVIFCRNVLVYLTPQAIAQVLFGLGEALSPGGLLFLGPSDVPSTPPGLKPSGPAELCIYQKGTGPKSIDSVSLRARSWTPTEAALTLSFLPQGQASPMRNRIEKPAPVALHIKILQKIENNDNPEAGRQLEGLVHRFPRYLPGLFEAAVWNARHHKKAAAESLMRKLLRKLQGKDRTEMLPGPQNLPVDFYRVSARTFLGEGGDPS